MINNMTFGIHSTNTWTGIATFVVDAGTILGTICVEYTFRTTFSIWISVVFRQTGARANAIAFLANSIGATRTWTAGLTSFLWYYN